MATKTRQLVVSEFHAETNKSEVARIDMFDPDGKMLGTVIVQHLGSRDCIVVDMAYPDSEMVRIERFYYG